MPDYFVHESSYVDEGAVVGAGTKIWHFCHVMPGAVIGERCNLGQNVVVMSGVRMGNNVKVQNNVSLYQGVVLEDDTFCGPSCVFTNVATPRSHVSRKEEYVETVVKRGASVGANATVVCGVTLGEYSFVGAGAVVTRDVPPQALVVGIALGDTETARLYCFVDQAKMKAFNPDYEYIHLKNILDGDPVCELVIRPVEKPENFSHD